MRKTYRDDSVYRATILVRARGRLRENTALIQRILAETPCVDCGESDPVVLEFHHRDAAQKKGTITDMKRSASTQAMIAEVAKCDVLCANCHRRRHWREGTAGLKGKPLPSPPLPLFAR